MARTNLQDSILLFSILYEGALGHMCPLLTTVATFFKFRTKAFLHMNYFYWHLDYDAQKPTFEKCPPNNGAICLEHEHESFSVCSSDRILGSESASSDSKLWELLSYIYESLNCDFLFFRNLSPPVKVCVLHNYLQIASLRS